ncbi:MAG: hypothetical protein CL940_06965 [Deltaproteobacteria bacterium]|nr:hypothetical protein [Deltaproteobacteria bacterium]|tara:strand:+ start:323 stop:550 length:228 start_codon:yes stop_codon:yes gene_type:complete
MSPRKTEEDDDRKLKETEPSETAEVATRMVVLARTKAVTKERAPKGKIEPRVVPWSGPKEDTRPPSIGSMQPPGK